MGVTKLKPVPLEFNGYNYKGSWIIPHFISFVGNQYDSPLYSCEHFQVQISIRNSLKIRSENLEILFHFPLLNNEFVINYRFVIENSNSKNSDVLTGDQIINSQNNEFSIFANHKADEIGEELGFIQNGNLKIVFFFTVSQNLSQQQQNNNNIMNFNYRNTTTLPNKHQLHWTISEPISEFHMTEEPFELTINGKKFNVALVFLFDTAFQLTFAIKDSTFSFTGLLIVSLINHKFPDKTLRKLHCIRNNVLDPFFFYEVTADQLNDQKNGWILYSQSNEVDKGLSFDIEFIEENSVRSNDDNQAKDELLTSLLATAHKTEQYLKERDPISIEPYTENQYLIKLKLKLKFPNVDLTNESKLYTAEYRTGNYCTKYSVDFSTNQLNVMLTNEEGGIVKFEIKFINKQPKKSIKKTEQLSSHNATAPISLPYTLESLKNPENGWLLQDDSFEIHIYINSKNDNLSWNQPFTTKHDSQGFSAHKYLIPFNLFFDKQVIEFPPLLIESTTLRFIPTILINSDEEITTSCMIQIPNNTPADLVFTYENTSAEKSINTIFCDNINQNIEFKSIPKVTKLESSGFVFNENGKKFVHLIIRMHNSSVSYNSLTSQSIQYNSSQQERNYEPILQPCDRVKMTDQNDAFEQRIADMFNDKDNVYIPYINNIESKQTTGYVGLHNQGTTCYMNSILQSLFHLPAFRRLVYEMPTTEYEDMDKSIPLNLQKLFCQMQLSDKSCSTVSLTNSFGWTTAETFMQHDVVEFLRVLIDNLETKMKGTNLEKSIPMLLKGQFRSYIKCKHVNYQTSHIEDFYDLSMSITNLKNLDESFRNYIQPDELVGKNQYKTDDFGLQDAIMGTEFLSFPPVLHIQLRRFMFGPNGLFKVNDHFEFPRTIDLNPYLADDAPGKANDNVYDLYGVLVHSGSGFGGHYYAFLRTSTSEQWYRFNDSIVQKDTYQHAVEDNYGNPISNESSLEGYSRIEDFGSDEDDVNEDWTQIERECNQEEQITKQEKYHAKTLTSTSSQAIDICTGYDSNSISYNQQSPNINRNKLYSGYMLIYVRRSDAADLFTPVDDSVAIQLRDYFDKLQNSKNEKTETELPFEVHFVQESILKTNSADRIRGFQQLNKDLYGQNVELFDKSVATNIFYETIAQRVNLNPQRIRIWKCLENNYPLSVIPNDANITIGSIFANDRNSPTRNIFIQPLKDDEEQINIGNNIMIYVKFFFSSILLSKQNNQQQFDAPLQYLFSIPVDPNEPIQSISSHVCSKIGLPTEIKLKVYQETLKSKLTELSLDQSFKSNKIGNSSILIFQCDQQFEELPEISFDFQSRSQIKGDLPLISIDSIPQSHYKTIEEFSIVEDLITFEMYKLDDLSSPPFLLQFSSKQTFPSLKKFLLNSMKDIEHISLFTLIDGKIMRIDHYTGPISASFSQCPPSGLNYNRLYYYPNLRFISSIPVSFSFDITEEFSQKLYFPKGITYKALLSIYRNVLNHLKPILVKSNSEDLSKIDEILDSEEEKLRVLVINKSGILSLLSNLEEQVECLANRHLRIEKIPDNQLSPESWQAVNFISSESTCFVFERIENEHFKDTKLRLIPYLHLQSEEELNKYEFILQIRDIKTDTMKNASDMRNERQSRESNNNYSFEFKDGASEIVMDDFAVLTDFANEPKSQLIIRPKNPAKSDDSRPHLNPSRSVKLYH